MFDEKTQAKSKPWNSQCHFTHLKKDFHLGQVTFKNADLHSSNHEVQEIHLYSKYTEIGCKQR